MDERTMDARVQGVADQNRLTMAYERAHHAFARAIDAERAARLAILVATGSLLLALAAFGILLFGR